MAVPDHSEGFAGRRDSAWSDTLQRPAARLGTRILIAGSVIAIAGAGAVVVWMLRFAPPVPSVVVRPLRPEAAAAGGSAEKENAPRTQAPSPKVPGLRARRATSPAVAPGAADAGARAATAPAVVAEDTTPDLGKAPAVPAVPAARAVAPAPAAAAPYTASDADVTPPQPVRQQWLRALPAGSAGDVVTIEVVVNKRGTVESVRMNSTPRSLGEFMLFTMSLHAIKAWEFRPALKDGNPVLYRQVMSLGGIASKPRPIPDSNGF
jgi:hypothetical protein